MLLARAHDTSCVAMIGDFVAHFGMQQTRDGWILRDFGKQRFDLRLVETDAAIPEQRLLNVAKLGIFDPDRDNNLFSQFSAPVNCFDAG